MKAIKLILVTALLMVHAAGLYAASGLTATEDDIMRLKKDLVDGDVQIGKTRLKQIKSHYGEAATINESQSKVTYNYGDLKVDFDKERYWKGWEYDSFKPRAYTDDIDDLRFALESNSLVGENITYTKIQRDYGLPTEFEETEGDGNMSYYYYGNIKLDFENRIILRSWNATNVKKDDAVSTDGILVTK